MQFRKLPRNGKSVDDDPHFITNCNTFVHERNPYFAYLSIMHHCVDSLETTENVVWIYYNKYGVINYVST